METIVHPPRTGIEVFQMLPEGTLCQLINDTIVMSPAPLLNHQDLCGKIYAAILWKVSNNQTGQVFIAPVDVYLNDRNAFQPDIVFVTNERKNILKENGIYGAPDLVIEILSKGNAAYDRGAKKDVYEQSGVKELWLINPKTKVCEGFVLQNGRFEATEPSVGQFQIRLLNIDLSF